MSVVSHSLTPPEHLADKPDLKLVAYVWECGDDYCDCAKPVIAWQTSRSIPGSSAKAYDREAIWTGTFVSRGDSDPDDPDPDEELRAECDRLGIVLGDT